MADNRCVCCGEIIPEGSQVCYSCANKELKMKIRSTNDAVLCLNRHIARQTDLVVLTREEAIKIRNLLEDHIPVIQNGENNSCVVNNGTMTMNIGG